MYSVAMSVVDYLPVCFFAIAVFILQRDLFNKMSKGAYALFCAGTIDVFISGFLKATYKLLYALNICDFEPLNAVFFPLQALGFLMCGVAIICMLTINQKEKVMALTPVLFKGTMIFVTMMVFGVISLNTCLGIIANRMKKRNCLILFIISGIMSLAMGYLSSKDFTNPMFNWIGEITNSIGQLSLLIGVKILDKAGLNKYEIKG